MHKNVTFYTNLKGFSSFQSLILPNFGQYDEVWAVFGHFVALDIELHQTIIFNTNLRGFGSLQSLLLFIFG